MQPNPPALTALRSQPMEPIDPRIRGCALSIPREQQPPHHHSQHSLSSPASPDAARPAQRPRRQPRFRNASARWWQRLRSATDKHAESQSAAMGMSIPAIASSHHGGRRIGDDDRELPAPYREVMCIPREDGSMEQVPAHQQVSMGWMRRLVVVPTDTSREAVEDHVEKMCQRLLRYCRGCRWHRSVGEAQLKRVGWWRRSVASKAVIVPEYGSRQR